MYGIRACALAYMAVHAQALSPYGKLFAERKSSVDKIGLDRTILVSSMFGLFVESLGASWVIGGLRPIMLGPIETEDITYGYAYIDNDVCVSTVAIVGQYLRALQLTDDLPSAVLVAELCSECRSICLENLTRMALDQAGFPTVGIERLPKNDLAAACTVLAPSTYAPSMKRHSGNQVTIGLFGPAPVLLTRAFHEAVTDRLEANGIKVVMPRIESLIGQRDVFEPAIADFANAGIQYVIGVIPFGCMSGHAYARGRLRTLQKLYPDMQITLIDYDPSASDINTVNRTELVIQSIFED